MSMSDFQLEGVWSGSYHRRKVFGLDLRKIFGLDLDVPVQFYAEFERISNGNCNGIRGRIYEPNTFLGRYPSGHFAADILGLTIGDDHSVSFRKSYDGTANISLGINYKGEMNKERNRIAGWWRFGWLSSGTFELTREDPEHAAKFSSNRAALLGAPVRRDTAWTVFIIWGIIITVILASLWWGRMR